MNYLKSIAPKNIKFTGFVLNKKLTEYYQKAKVYVQMSAHEAFGYSVSESILYGCIPLITKKLYLKLSVTQDITFLIK